MRVVLDTNIFLVGCLPRHKYAWITDELIQGTYDLCVSNEILFEYQEKISDKLGLGFIEETVDVIIKLRNVHHVDPKFQWQLIEHDPDDNKFVDCAISGRADYIISNDRHFRTLSAIDFPEVRVLRLAEFKNILK